MAERAVPILLGRDLDTLLAFYERLGFENRGAPPGQWDYLIIGRGSIELHFSKQPNLNPLTTDCMCYLYVDDAGALFADWEKVVVRDSATGSRIVAPMTTDYGMTEFAVIDPSGNLLRIGTQYK